MDVALNSMNLVFSVFFFDFLAFSTHLIFNIHIVHFISPDSLRSIRRAQQLHEILFEIVTELSQILIGVLGEQKELTLMCF